MPIRAVLEMDNNEVKGGVQQGYWLIDDHGNRWLVYDTHQRFLAQARAYVADFLKRRGRVPTREEYGKAAGRLDDAPPAARKAAAFGA